jgi:hypothetical protein
MLPPQWKLEDVTIEGRKYLDGQNIIGHYFTAGIFGSEDIFCGASKVCSLLCVSDFAICRDARL